MSDVSGEIRIGGDVTGSQVAIGDQVEQHLVGDADREAKPHVVLLVAANPIDTDRLRLDEEARTMDDCLREGEYRDRLDFRSAWAARAGDLSKALLRWRPVIVHFSGHGSSTGRLILQDQRGFSHEPPAEAVADLLGQFADHVRCVVLNACHSAALAERIAERVECVVGTSRAIRDRDAERFASGFYQAVAAGESVQKAFDLGRIEVGLTGSAGADIPHLLVRTGIDADEVRVVDGAVL